MKYIKYIIAAVGIVAATIVINSAVIIAASAAGMTVTYTPMGVPGIDSSFKSYEDYGCITDRTSPQYKYLNDWCWVDYDGFVRCDGEKDLGITDNYYCVAMGSYYGMEIGSKYRITTDTGNVFYVVLCDQKDDSDTDNMHQYGTDNNDIFEFIVNVFPWEIKTNGRKNKQYLPGSERLTLNGEVSFHGTANVYMPLNGKVVSVERIEFIRE